MEIEQICVICGSNGQFLCRDHCSRLFCSKCTGKHRLTVVRDMKYLLRRLEFHATHFPENLDGTEKKFDRMENERKRVFESIQKDLLLDEEQIGNIEKKLYAQRQLHQSIDVSFLVTREKMQQAAATDQQISGTPRTPKLARPVTVSLSKTKYFTPPMQKSFSVGPHPIVVSLRDRYIRTVLCEWKNNTVILISRTKLDVYARGSALLWSIPMKLIIRNPNEKIYTATWCSYIQRLIIVGRFNFYFFDLNNQKTLCHCEDCCGCSPCSSGLMTQASRRRLTITYPCPYLHDDPIDTERFILTTNDGLLIYAFKREDHFMIYKYRLKPFSEQLAETYQEFQEGFLKDSMNLISIFTLKSSIAALASDGHRLFLIHRNVADIQRKQNNLTIFSGIQHYLTQLDFSFTKRADDIALPSELKWITSVLPYDNASKLFLSDPYGQQLILYDPMEQILMRRFRICPMNLCILTDGRLVLWIEKAYPNAPIGKLHFISPPHLELSQYIMNSKDALSSSQMVSTDSSLTLFVQDGSNTERR